MKLLNPKGRIVDVVETEVEELLRDGFSKIEEENKDKKTDGKKTDYDKMSRAELFKECKKRGTKVKATMKTSEIIKMLNS